MGLLGRAAQASQGENPKTTAQSNGYGIAALTAQLWHAAVNLRGSIEPADYKRYVLPIIFLRFLSLHYERRGAELERLIADPASEHHTTDAGVAAEQAVPGFCRVATLDEVRAHGYALTPGRYVGSTESDEDEEPFEEKMPRLVAELERQFAEGRQLERRFVGTLRSGTRRRTPNQSRDRKGAFAGHWHKTTP
ncbi:MAG TPA: type I restriction-modification system subunit M N-terminal domain-containing protein [Candidatus Acidoferrales bacterium]|nr:type I restriction-modification system subunit M N-terminal domain-containing protein [Candidatus Acidoferrales bacterium]